MLVLTERRGTTSISAYSLTVHAGLSGTDIN